MSRSPTEASGSPLRAMDAPPAGLFARWHARQSRHLAYLAQGGLWGHAPGDAMAEWYGDWATWCAAHPGVRVDLVLAGSVTHQLVVVDATLPLASEAEVMDYARQQFAYFHGTLAQTWPLSVWADGSTYVASALHGSNLSALRATAAQHRVSLLSVRPWWTIALQVAMDLQPPWGDHDAQALVLVDGNLATWVGCKQGRVTVVHQRRLARAHADDLCALLHSLQRQHAVQPGATWVVAFGIDGDRACMRSVCRVEDSVHADQPPRRWLAA